MAFQFQCLAPSKEISLGNGHRSKNSFFAAVSCTKGHSAGGLFGNIDLQYHLIISTSLDGIDFYVFKIIETIKVSHASFQIFTTVKFPFIHLKLPPNHFVSRFRIAGDNNFFKIDLFPLMNNIRDIHLQFFNIFIDSRRYIGIGITFIRIEIRKRQNIITHDFAIIILLFGNFESCHQIIFG